MDTNQQIMTYLKKNHGASLDALAKETQKSSEYIRGIVESDPTKIYKIVGDTITLKGLGDNLCVVCGEANTYFGSVPIRIPESILRGRQTSISKIKGHRKCYATIDVFFREDNILKCGDCSNSFGGWVDGDEVEEQCIKIDHKVTGHQGVLFGDPMCNYFSPDRHMCDKGNKEYDKKRGLWNEIEQAIEQRTLKGYQNLIEILEKTKLIK